jgi:hypothetical protein
MTDLFSPGEIVTASKLNQLCIDATIAKYTIRLNGTTYEAIDGNTKTKPYTNATLNTLIDTVLAAMTAGTLYLKECAFNYSATIPANVAVVESVNGLVRTFINSTNSAGSPYTISTKTEGGTTRYFCQDSADRYINDSTSTTASSVFQSVHTACVDGDKIIIAEPLIFITGLTVTKQITIEATSNTQPNMIFTGTGDALTLNVTGWITLRNIYLDGSHTVTHGIISTGLSTIYIDYVTVKGCEGRAFNIPSGGGTYVQGTCFKCFDCKQEGFYADTIQIALNDIYSSGCGSESGNSSVYFKVVTGYVGRLVAAGAGALYGGDAYYGFHLASTDFLTIGLLHVEDTTHWGVIIGTSTSSTVNNVDIGSIEVYNTAKESTGTDFAPILANAGRIRVGSIMEDYNGAEPYTVSIVSYNVYNFDVSNIKIQQTISRGAYAHNGAMRVHGLGYEGGGVFSDLGEGSHINHLLVAEPTYFTVTSTNFNPPVIVGASNGVTYLTLYAKLADGSSVASGVTGSWSAVYLP